MTTHEVIYDLDRFELNVMKQTIYEKIRHQDGFTMCSWKEIFEKVQDFLYGVYFQTFREKYVHFLCVK